MLSVLISVVVTLVVPKLISVEQYGYYQIYVFYISYVGVSYLGWCDGIYLRMGGKYYGELDKPLYGTQFWLLGLFEVVVYAVIFGGSFLFVRDASTRYIVTCVCIVAVGMCLRWFITFVLQATARIREYATVTISEKILFVILIAVFMAAGYRDFRWIVAADVAAKFLSLFTGVWYCRDMVFAKLLPVRSVIGEIKENCRAGIKLMLASLCSMLIVGVVRFGIQNHWDVSTYGKVSLTLSVSNMIMTAISAISVVLYPTLCRTSKSRLPSIYRIMRIVLMGLVFGFLVFYYPIRRVLSAWLPQYAESLRYAAILFPVCAYESKMSLLVNTYYKTLRLENLLMKCNMAALAFSVVCTVVSTLVLNSVTAAIFSILLTLIFRCVVSELLLARHIDIGVKKDIVIELAMTAAFIVCNWFFGFAGMLVYAGCYAAYLFIKRGDLKETLAFVKSMR